MKKFLLIFLSAITTFLALSYASYKGYKKYKRKYIVVERGERN